MVLGAGVRAEMDENVLFREVGEKHFILRGTVHRLPSAGGEEVSIFEVPIGEFDEEDIVRLRAVYGRSGLSGEAEGPAKTPSSVIGALQSVSGVCGNPYVRTPVICSMRKPT